MTSREGARVILARHGRTRLNAAGFLRGHLDPPLDSVGLEEVEALATALASEHIQVVVTSPLRRARQTAQAIARASGALLAVDERLIDRDYGPWAGYPMRRLTDRFGSIDDAPGVESAASVRHRALHVLEDAQLIHPSPVVLVAHDAVNTILLGALCPRLARDPHFGQDTACWNVLAWSATEGRWLVEEVNRSASPVRSRTRSGPDHDGR